MGKVYSLDNGTHKYKNKNRREISKNILKFINDRHTCCRSIRGLHSLPWTCFDWFCKGSNLPCCSCPSCSGAPCRWRSPVCGRRPLQIILYNWYCYCILLLALKLFFAIDNLIKMIFLWKRWDLAMQCWQLAMPRLETQCLRLRWVLQPILPSSILSTNINDNPKTFQSCQISFAGETSAPMNFKNSLLVTVPEGHEELEVTTVLIIGLLTMIMILQVSCTASNSAGSATETATVSVHSKLLYDDYRKRKVNFRSRRANLGIWRKYSTKL